MGGLSIWHWLIVLVVVVLIFGTKRLRNVGKDLGGAVKDFRKGMADDRADSDQRSPERLADDARAPVDPVHGTGTFDRDRAVPGASPPRDDATRNDPPPR